VLSEAVIQSVLVPKSNLYEFLAQAQEDEVAAKQSLRQWIRQTIN
jgi:hypothetical protein